MKESQEFKERKTLIELRKEADKLRHQQAMAQLIFQRKTNEVFHEQALERLRIKSAEIRKTQLRKVQLNE